MALHLAHLITGPLYASITPIHATFDAIDAPFRDVFPPFNASVPAGIAPIQPVFSAVNPSFHAPISAIIPAINPTVHTEITPVTTNIAPVGLPAISPASAFAIPGTSAVIGIPVRSNREADDRDINFGHVLHKRDIGAARRIAQIPGIDPSTVAIRAHVAPTIAGYAPVHIHRRALRHNVDYGEGCRGTGSHIKVHCHDCILGRGYGWHRGDSEEPRRYRNKVPSHELFLSTQTPPSGRPPPPREFVTHELNIVIRV